MSNLTKLTRDKHSLFLPLRQWQIKKCYNFETWSENLIKDLLFKQRLGLKADLVDEVVAVVEHAVEKADQVEKL